MSADIHELPEERKASKRRRDLANYLRMIADGIEADELETEPHGFALILTGRTQHEALCAGYAEDGDGFTGALHAAYFIGGAGYLTAGRNIRKREGGHYGRPYRNENVVQFAPPARKTAPASDGAPDAS